MARLLDSFYNALLGAGLLGLVACSTPRYAHRDYDQFPAARPEIGLHNIKQIAGDICEESAVTEDEFRCTKNASILSNRFPAECPNGYTLQEGTLGYQSCRQEIVILWDRVRKVIPGSNLVEVCLEDRTCVRLEKFRNRRQAREFAEAIHAYLQ